MLYSEYETTLVVRPDVSGDAVEGTLDKVRDAISKTGGKLLAINHWGKKKLAYEIKKQSRGIYVHTHYLGGGELVAEIERNLRISDSVLRYLTVNLAVNIEAGEREAQEYVPPKYDEVVAEPVDDEEIAAADADDDGDDDDAPVAEAAADESAEVAGDEAGEDDNAADEAVDEADAGDSDDAKEEE